MKKSTGKKGGAKVREDHARSWERHFAAWRQSGLGVTAYCKRKRLAVSTFHYWRRRLGQGGARRDHGRRASKGAAGFVEVSLGPRGLSQPPFEVSVGGRWVRVVMQFEEVALRNLLAVLEDQPCG